MSEKFNRTVVVTGASRGLGLEWTKQLAQDPDTLVIAVVRNVDRATALQPVLGNNVVPVQAEMSDIESFQTVAMEISQATGGKVDVLINNAGIMIGAAADPGVGISKSTAAEWQETFHVNVTSPVLFTTALLGLLKAGREKKVVNIASFFGDSTWTLEHPGMHNASYAVSKAAIILATQKFHNEFKNEGFTFLALSPGWVNTDMGGAYASLTAQNSVEQCLRFVKRSTTNDSGGFFTLDGRKQVAIN